MSLQSNKARLADSLGKPQSYVAKVELVERRLDIVEFFDWISALGYPIDIFLQDVGWVAIPMVPSDHIFPIPGTAEEVAKGTDFIVLHQTESFV